MQDTAKKRRKCGPIKSAPTTPLSIRVPNATLAEIADAATSGNRVRGVGEVPLSMFVRRRSRFLAAPLFMPGGWRSRFLRYRF